MTSEPENGMVEVLRHPNLVFADQARELLEEDGVHVYMREESVGGSGLGVSGVLSSFPGMEYVLFVPEASLAKARDILAAMPTDSQTSAEALPWVHDEGQLAPPASLVGLRPLLITLACALGAVGYFCLIALLIFQGQTYVAHATRVGAHYFPFLFIRNAADLIRLYGYWTMRKWSVYLCAILIVVGVSESLLTRTLIKPFGITMEIIILGLGILYYKRMK